MPKLFTNFNHFPPKEKPYFLKPKPTDNSPLFSENSPTLFFLLTQNESMMNDIGHNLIIDYPVKPKKRKKVKPIIIYHF